MTIPEPLFVPSHHMDIIHISGSLCRWEAPSPTRETAVPLISSTFSMHQFAEGSLHSASVSLWRPSRSLCYFSRPGILLWPTLFLTSCPLTSTLTRPLSFSLAPCCHVVTAAPHPPKPSRYCLPLRCVTSQSLTPSLWSFSGQLRSSLGE